MTDDDSDFVSRSDDIVYRMNMLLMLLAVVGLGSVGLVVYAGFRLESGGYVLFGGFLGSWATASMIGLSYPASHGVFNGGEDEIYPKALLIPLVLAVATIGAFFYYEASELSRRDSLMVVIAVLGSPSNGWFLGRVLARRRLATRGTG